MTAECKTPPKCGSGANKRGPNTRPPLRTTAEVKAMVALARELGITVGGFDNRPDGISILPPVPNRSGPDEASPYDKWISENGG